MKYEVLTIQEFNKSIEQLLSMPSIPCKHNHIILDSINKPYVTVIPYVYK